MILLGAVIAGLAAGLGRARIGRRRYQAPDFDGIWLIPLAFFPQLLAFYLPWSRELIPDSLARLALVSSQSLLLVFAWWNRRQPGIWLLGIGLGLNLIVILSNGGLMPITPDVVGQIAPAAPAGSWEVGLRLGTGKDIVLPREATRLWWLSDRFLLPDFLATRVAFSMGDGLIAAGAFWVLWKPGGPRPTATRISVGQPLDRH